MACPLTYCRHTVASWQTLGGMKPSLIFIHLKDFAVSVFLGVIICAVYVPPNPSPWLSEGSGGEETENTFFSAAGKTTPKCILSRLGFLQRHSSQCFSLGSLTCFSFKYIYFIFFLSVFSAFFLPAPRMRCSNLQSHTVMARMSSWCCESAQLGCGGGEGAECYWLLQ